MTPYWNVTIRYSVLVLSLLFLLSVFLFTYHSEKKSQFLSHPVVFGQEYSIYDSNYDDYTDINEKNELDGCYHVYLDVGSNIGNQIRKLYEPHLYVNSSILPIFTQYFGNIEDRQQKSVVCAIGFEPNPHHTEILKKLQSSYDLCDWKIKIFTNTAAAHCYGMATFFSDKNTEWREWGGSIVFSKIAKEPVGVAKMMRLVDYIHHKVITRKLPSSLNIETMKLKPNVIMKLDIEGSELEVITDLVVSGALQHIDLALVEYHSKSFYKSDFRNSAILGLEKTMDTLNYLSRTLKLKNMYNVKTFNDESYAKVSYPFPIC